MACLFVSLFADAHLEMLAGLVEDDVTAKRFVFFGQLRNELELLD